MTTTFFTKYWSSTPCCVLQILLLLASVTSSPDPFNFRFLPNINEEIYQNLGDINIGAIASLKFSSGYSHDVCSNKVINSSYSLASTETIAFVVDAVNRNPKLLPNVSLGFVIRDMCLSSKIALATSLSFLPRTENVCNGTVCYKQATQTTYPKYLSHDVIGVLSPTSSGTTVPISTLYGVAHLPLMGYTTTSDELSDKVGHPYFFRVVPPDRYNIQAMLKFITANGWSYISMLYTSGSYGEKAFDTMKQSVGDYGICIATSHRLFHSTDYDQVVSDLLENSRARVVVVFTGTTSFSTVLQAVVNQNATGHFIWIGADAVARYAGYDYEGADSDPAIGTFTFDLYTAYVPEYYEYLKQQNPSTTKNPWMKPLWEFLFDCSFDKGTCDPEANALQSDKYYPSKATSLRLDAVLAFAHAAHNLLSERCPNARGAHARACISGELLRDYLRNVTFEGFSGHIEFDQNHDLRGKYVISQLVYDYYKFPFVEDTNSTGQKRIFDKKIGLYDISTDTITYFNETISWSHLDDLARIVPWNEDSLPLEIPESVCSRPCLAAEYKIEKELPCCWECRKCRENERIVSGNSSCEKCPEFTWPDPASAYTKCKAIPLTHPSLTDSLPVILTCFAIFVIIITISIFIGYIVYRNERVVKAGSRELSLLQLVAIFVGYLTVILFQTPPTHGTCGAIYFMFCMSFAWLYSPLLVKSVRIYRIFRSGTKHNQRPRFVSPQTQLIAAVCLSGFQVLLCVITYSFVVPTSRRNQPIWSEKFVELSCDLTLTGLASFLSYNIVLVSLCSVFAFKTRKLPDNFNESKFISMCVSTTLVIWLAFIPTYFTADREFVRVLLLSIALLLNHSVALLFLFVPKIYAAIFLTPETANFNATTRFHTTASVFPTSSNRVAPAPSVSTIHSSSRTGS